MSSSSRPSPMPRAYHVTPRAEIANGEPPSSTLYQLVEQIRDEQKNMSRRFTMLEGHMMQMHHRVNIATWPSRLPLWFIAGALFTLALVALAFLLLRISGG